ncbi:MAG: sigma-70 family RNA polymerase sigma factor [Bryobacteraceae bacterium]|nr:sigma-70 family RNA polymerase sigma factor [Bryobacteraceae bacterium]
MTVDLFSHEDGNDSLTGMGDRERLDYLFSVAYEELHRLASLVRRRDPNATISPATLVNEAWIKLSKSPEVAASSPLHFKRIAACAMRQVLVTAARRRTATKRSAGVVVVFDEALCPPATREEELLALDDALEELARMNPRHAQMVEGRFFGGLEVPEIANLLGVSEATVLRDWRAARAWLGNRMGH